MSIQRISTNLTTTEKIQQLNEMLIELAGLVGQGKFDINEIDSIYDDLNFNRKYLRNVSLGHTVGTYSNWTHVKAETGYSIWKIAPSNYSYSALNQLYFDNMTLVNKGQATGETATAFDSVQLYDGVSAYANLTSEAGTEGGTELAINADTGDYLYIGHASQFSGVKFEFQTRGSGYVLEFEYWNGSSWADLTSSGNYLVDDTSNFESDGLLSFTAPVDWATATVNSVASKYWIRIKTNSTPVTIAKAYFIIPGSTVVGLLALSSDQIFAGEWAWCSYSGSVYVTIRNSGNSTYEGDYFLTSSSTTINKQNFFIYNHEFKLDYIDSTYVNSFTSDSKIINNIFTPTASKTIASSVAETSLFGTGLGSLTIPANFLIVGRSLRVKLFGYFGTTGTPTLNIKALLGGSTVCSTGAIATSGTISNRYWEAEIVLTCRTIGVSGTVIGQGLFTYDNSTQAGKAVGLVATATTTVNTTGTLALDVTATWGASSASNTITCTNATVEVIN